MTDYLPQPSEVTAATWVCVRQRRLLVVRPEETDAFYLPGGTPEAGETLPQTAAREVLEETGIQLDPTQLAPLIEVVAPAHGRPGTIVRLVCFSAESDQLPSPAAEIAEVAWFTTAESPRCAPAVRDVITLLDRMGILD